MVATIELNAEQQEELLIKISEMPDCVEVLEEAEKMEIEMANGMPIITDSLIMKAEINPDTSCWEIVCEVDHGKIIYTGKDKLANVINVTTIPSTKYIIQDREMTEDEISTVQMKYSRSLDIDFNHAKSVTRAKEFFKGDYVLSNIILDNDKNHRADEMVVWHLRAYRRFFNEHMKAFSFLWDGTSYYNARSLAGAMRDRGLIK